MGTMNSIKRQILEMQDSIRKDIEKVREDVKQIQLYDTSPTEDHLSAFHKPRGASTKVEKILRNSVDHHAATTPVRAPLADRSREGPIETTERTDDELVDE